MTNENSTAIAESRKILFLQDKIRPGNSLSFWRIVPKGKTIFHLEDNNTAEP